MKIKLDNVRLSYPNLFAAKSFQGGPAKFSASFIMDKETHAKLIAKVDKAIDTVMKDGGFKGKRSAIKGVCLRDGEEKTNDDGTAKDGYGEEVMFLNASNASRPQVVDKDPSIPLTAEDSKIYAGCYVNAIIHLWWQDNDFGKRVNATLKAVQFVRDGESFGEAPVNVEEEFSDLSEEDEEELG
jgi:hypothetical protein